MAQVSFLLSVLVVTACSPDVSKVGAADTAVWIRLQGPYPGGEELMVGQAFVLSTNQDYCSLFRERWLLLEEAVAARGERFAELPDGPSEDRCIARKEFWNSQIEAERKLYFQPARHMVGFVNEITFQEGSDWIPVTAGTPSEGSAVIGATDHEEGETGVTLSVTRAKAGGLLPQDLLDCTDPAVQSLVENSFYYPGPPRERWLADAGRAEFTREGENAWRLRVDDANMTFVEELSYVRPTEKNGWDPRVSDEEPRDAVTVNFERRFDLCEVETPAPNWWSLWSWAMGGWY